MEGRPGDARRRAGLSSIHGQGSLAQRKNKAGKSLHMETKAQLPVTPPHEMSSHRPGLGSRHDCPLLLGHPLYFSGLCSKGVSSMKPPLMLQQDGVLPSRTLPHSQAVALLRLCLEVELAPVPSEGRHGVPSPRASST